MGMRKLQKSLRLCRNTEENIQMSGRVYYDLRSLRLTCYVPCAFVIFLFAHEGRDDCREHVRSKMHANFVKKLAIFQPLILTIHESHDNTGEGIFKVLDGELRKREIPWENCEGFSCDNASTMTGVSKAVISFLSKVNENIHVQGCACHLVHLAAQKGCGGLENVNVEHRSQSEYFSFSNRDRIDEIWFEVSKITGSSGMIKYPSLTKLMITVLIPHSNSPPERIFSLKKYCYQATFTKHQLPDAKRATGLYNLSSASTSTQGSSIDTDLTEESVDNENL
ncbi:hypothetical protein PR048_026496 [Dryococelus australis]|uniref:Uncharacterized protein n=1 Tax=Dryococelus australis TaxID=614101 RepID=A0ABQ9GLH8_9NEOP|nr:hypothetical protein PR048_026496 [Dryococelus australis]